MTEPTLPHLLGVFTRRHPLAAACIGVVAPLVMIWWLGSSPDAQPARSAAPQKPVAEPVQSARKIACRGEIEARKVEYVQLLDKKAFWDAGLALGDCPGLLEDKALIDMQEGARRLSRITTATDTRASTDDRLRAIAGLAPADSEKFESVRVKLQTQADKEAAAAAKKRDAAEKVRRRKEGVSLGMSKEEVLASNWGRPRKVNTSTYTFGVHEQWVYDGGYLYFKDGVLTSIQN